MNRSYLRAGVAALATLTLLMPATPATAHGEETVGEYHVVSGWATEPAYAGFPNAVQVILTDHDGNPITDLGAGALKVEVIYGDQKIGPLPLEPAFKATSGEPGDYRAAIIPTRTGDYTFHFTGNIKDQPVDKSVTSGPETFHPITDPNELAFPEKDPSIAELAQGHRALADQVQTLGNKAEEGSGSSSIPLILSIAALALAAFSFAKTRKSS